MSKSSSQSEPVRWSIERGHREFSIDRRTLQKRLAELSIVAGADGFYSTADIARAVFGDLAGVRLRKLQAEADLADIEVAKAVGELCLAADADATLTHYATRVRSIIEAARYLDEPQKAKLFEQLIDIPDPEL